MSQYDLIFEHREGYLYACVTAAKIDRKTALEYLHRVADAVRDSPYNRLMLERDIPAVLSTADIFFTAEDFLDLVRGLRVAFVNTHATIQAELEFAMLIGTNRGAKYGLFNNVPDAEKWLLGSAKGV